MKNAVVLALTAGLIFVMAFSLISCEPAPAKTTSGTEASSRTHAGVSSGTSESSAGQPESLPSQVSTPDSYDIKKYATMEEYIKSDSVREEMETLNKTVNEYGMELTASAEGDHFVYTYRMTQDIDASKMVESLEKLLDEQTDSFTLLANELKYKVKTDGTPAIVIRYVDIHGDEFCTREYPAE